jgi:hypothetical protein
MSKLL